MRTDANTRSEAPGALRRVIGGFSTTCVGLGVAIGSGVFATPGLVAERLLWSWVILGVWLAAGLITLAESLVTAELATRFPRAGGEYEYLKQAYGRFAAFFFGWSYTVFVIGLGSAAIASALGGLVVELLGAGDWWGPVFGCGAITAVTAWNAAGLRTGAMVQNGLTLAKLLALVAIAVALWATAGRMTPMTSAAAATSALTTPATITSTEASTLNIVDASAPMPVASSRPATHMSLFHAFLLALVPAMWSYAGSTDSAKLAEEVRDVHRALPRALVASASILTLIYIGYNLALLAALTPTEMAGEKSVPAAALARHVGQGSRRMVLIISVLVCLGALSSTLMATPRVTFALARDGLTFKFLSRMSRRQAPIPAFVLGAAIACAATPMRSFDAILNIYYLASAVLFGLSYMSLLVFRRRDASSGVAPSSSVFVAPAGSVLAVGLLLLHLAIAANIIHDNMRNGVLDALYTAGFLASFAALYFVWEAAGRGRRVR